MSVEERVIAILLENKVGVVNYCCCEYRMVSEEGCVGTVGDVATGRLCTVIVYDWLFSECNA